MIEYDVISESTFSCESFVAQFAEFGEDSLMKFVMIFQIPNIHKLLVTF